MTGNFELRGELLQLRLEDSGAGHECGVQHLGAILGEPENLVGFVLQDALEADAQAELQEQPIALRDRSRALNRRDVSARIRVLKCLLVEKFLRHSVVGVHSAREPKRAPAVGQRKTCCA